MTSSAFPLLGRGGSPPEVVTELAPGFIDVRVTVEGVAYCGIRGEQVAEVGLGRGGVCPETKVGFERGRALPEGRLVLLLNVCPIGSWQAVCGNSGRARHCSW
jgi:hypothetical protein